MFLALATLAQLLQTCAPGVSPNTMTAIVRVESGGNTLAIRDNTIDRTFAPVDAREAIAWAKQLTGMGHSVDLGLSQINNANLPRLGLTVDSIFDPCVNLRAGATILGEDYANAVAHFGAGQYALRRALSAYNTGSAYAGQSYVNSILRAAGLAPETAAVAPAAVAAPRVALRPAPASAKTRHKKPAGPEPYTPHAAYTEQHTSGSPVTVYVGGQ